MASSWPGHGPLLLGALFVAAVYLLPRGLAGLRLGTGARGPAKGAELPPDHDSVPAGKVAP